MVTVLAVLVILTIVGLALLYVIKEKRRGVKCIGCPDGATCPHAKNGCCSCHNADLT